jgi:hypothetical protein
MGTTTQTVANFTASGEAGRVLTIQGTSASSPATLVFSGSGQATTPTTDYLTITGVRAYNLDTTWYAGANSTNNGSLGWYFEAAGGGAISVFIIEAATASDAQSSIATLNIGVSESITAADAQAAGLVYLGTLSESATASDLVDVLRLFVASVSESATAAEVLANIATLNVTVPESVNAAALANALATMGVEITEMLSAIEAVLSSRTLNPTIAEAATAQDAFGPLSVFDVHIDEITTAADASSVAPSTFSAIALAAAQAAESFNPAGSVYNAVLPTEGAGITDSLIGAFLWNDIDDNQVPNWQNVSNPQTPGWANVDDTQTPGWTPITPQG